MSEKNQIIEMIKESIEFIEIYSDGTSIPQYYKGTIDGMNLIIQNIESTQSGGDNLNNI